MASVHFRKFLLAGLPLVAAALFSSTPAWAQDPDGVRFRGGIAAGGGALLISGLSLGLGGVDARMGVQINDLIGVYVQPQLALYGGSIGAGGIVGGSAVVDFTLWDQLFGGIGGGGALVNNPSGGELHFRVGGYPLVGEGDDGVRRKGLMVGVDVRLYFLSGAVATVPMASVGYEAF